LEALEQWENKWGKVEIKYLKGSQPDFAGAKLVYGNANIGKFSRTDSGADIDSAWKQFLSSKEARQLTTNQLKWLQENCTWHHTAADGKLQLVPSAVHDAFAHTGGAAFSRAGLYDKAVKGAAFVSETVDAATSENPTPGKVAVGVVRDASKEVDVAVGVAKGYMEVGRRVVKSLQDQAWGPAGENDDFEKYRQQ
jgi:A nuclease of the HNH/ENDO VII superfamily with conserved WHH